MEVFFADDSSQKGIRAGMGPIVSFGGIILSAEELQSLEAEVNSIASRYGFPTGEEIKWSPPRKSWMRENLINENRTNCINEILTAAKDHGGRVIVVSFDLGRTSVQGDDAFQMILDFIFERLSVHLAKKQKLGIIVADRPGGGYKEDSELLESFIERTNYGTQYVKPDQIPLNILTTPSHLVRHLQIADLVTGITTAMVSGQTKYAQKNFPLVNEMMLKNHMGYVGGTGLKVFPTALTNLYHWVLGEKHFTKVSRGAGYPLPHKFHAYSENDGV